MKPFQAIRYLNGQKVRAVHDNETLSWWYSAMDVIHVLTKSDNSRRYWNNVKVRHFYNYFLYKKLKVRANDLKEYNSDVLNEEGIKLLVKLLPEKHIINYNEVIKELNISFDELIIQRCNHIYDCLMINNNILYLTQAVIEIQNYLFDSFNYNNFVFRNASSIDEDLYIKEILLSIDYMNEKSLEDLINKFIEFNLLKPFNHGNLVSGLIWLDLMIKERFKKCINFINQNKDDFINAINISYREPIHLYNIIKQSLCSELNNKELRNKNIDFIISIGNY